LEKKKKKKKKEEEEEEEEEEEVKMLKLQKFGSLGGCIAKIEILEVELKIAPNFGE
jgi:hypothetical protein